MKAKRKFIVVMSVMLLILLASMTLYSNGFRVDIASVIAILVGWAVGVAVLILLMNNMKLFKKKREE